jgi:hypothetical protein
MENTRFDIKVMATKSLNILIERDKGEELVEFGKMRVELNNY